MESLCRAHGLMADRPYTARQNRALHALERQIGSRNGLARAAPTQAHRYKLIDMANRVRPTSTF